MIADFWYQYPNYYFSVPTNTYLSLQNIFFFISQNMQNFAIHQYLMLSWHKQPHGVPFLDQTQICKVSWLKQKISD